MFWLMPLCAALEDDALQGDEGRKSIAELVWYQGHFLAFDVHDSSQPGSKWEQAETRESKEDHYERTFDWERHAACCDDVIILLIPCASKAQLRL